MAISGAPRIPASSIFRPRVRDRFTGDAAVVIARAPAGHGKTIAMAQWASTTESAGLWLRIRGAAVEASEFIQLLAEELCVEGVVSEGDPLGLAAESLAAGADPWTLLRGALRRMDGPLVLAIDGVDRLDRTVQRALADLAEEGHLVLRLTARRATVFDEPALGVTLDIETVTAAELALTREEAAEMLAMSPSDPLVDELMAHGGVPLLAKLVQLSHAERNASPGGESLPDVVDSFIRLRLEGPDVDEPFLRFVTVAALAEHLDAALAAQLMAAAGHTLGSTEVGSAETAARSLLDRAEAEGIGLWTHGASQPVFVFTPLVREAFERRLRTVAAESIQELTMTVARWEFRAGHAFAALRRSVEARDWLFASRVARSSWNELMRNHGPQLRELFRDIPLSVLRRYPLLATLLALDYNRTGRHRLRALEYFALARYGARTQRSTASPADRAVLKAIETASLRVSGQMSSAFVPAREGYDALLSLGPSDRDDLGRTEATLFNQFGTTFFYAGRSDLALDAFARSTAVGEARGLRGGLQGLALSAGTLAVAGDLPEARALIRQAEELDWPDGWRDGYMGSFLRLAQAMSALERLDPDAAERHIRALDPHRETIEHWPLLAHVDAVVALLRGHTDRARFQLDAEIRHQHRRRAAGAETVARLARTRSLIELAAGNPVAAEAVLERGRSPRTTVTLARIELARRRPEEALRRLLDAEGAAATGERSARVIGEDLVLRAASWALMDDRVRAADATRAAFEYLAAREQGMALVLLPADALEAVLDRARDSGVRVPVADVTRVPRIIPSTRHAATFTPRELALIRALPGASSNTDLAAHLSVSVNTVKTQLRGLYRKLDVGTREEALAALEAMGLMAAPARYDDPVSPDPFG